jgi:predicted phage-related endonuclease
MTTAAPTPRTPAPLDDVAAWIAAYQRAMDQHSHWKKTANTIQQKITAALDAAQAEVGTGSGTPKVRWTEVVSQRIDTVTFRAEHPELAAPYSHPCMSRRFSLIKNPAQLHGTQAVAA